MKTQKRRRKKRRDTLVLNLLILVAVVLVVFEGQLILTMITHRNAANGGAAAQSESDAAPADTGTLTAGGSNASGAAGTTPAVSTSLSSQDSTLAGLTGGFSGSSSATAQTEAVRMPTVSNPDSPAIVAERDTPMDDSYFSDAAFIGDSRMEGFRNASGITQGQFFTSVGMSLSSMTSESVIATADGNITVAAALSGDKYNKIYIMLGANDLGEYDWNAFHDGFVSVTRRFLEIQPDALIYICSCIYVEESKVTTGSYINNANVDKLNSILLQICEEEGYHYLDLNEFLSNGYGSLIEGASSDGVHIYETYCKQMLEYLKSHYVDAPQTADGDEEAETGAESETESETEHASV